MVNAYVLCIRMDLLELAYIACDVIEVGCCTTGTHRPVANNDDSTNKPHRMIKYVAEDCGFFR